MMSAPAPEKRSRLRLHEVTWYRLGVSVLVVGAILLGFAHHDVTSIYEWVLTTLVLSGPCFLFAVTEPESLPSRCRTPRSTWAALCVAPWLPGGGRGALFVLLHLALAVFAMFVARARWPEETCRVFHMTVTAMFATIYALLPTALCQPWFDSPRVRRAARIGVPAFMLGCFLLSACVADVEQERAFRGWLSQVLNPWEMGNLIPWHGLQYKGHEAAVGTVMVVTMVTVVVNTPRIVRGLRELVLRRPDVDSLEGASNSAATGAGSK